MGIDSETKRKLGFTGGTLEAGQLNLITDVPGISVGHFTLKNGAVQTGVTAVLSHQGNCFREKVPAAAHVINGFGKSAGLIQIQELGTVETPLVLTNTFAVGTASTALIKYMLKDNPDIGTTTGTVNPVVLECNDGKLNDIRGMHIKEEHVAEALRRAEAAGQAEAAGSGTSSVAGTSFEEGAVGAGTGMCCYELKGGIGSASRCFAIGGKTYTLGALVLTNFGRIGDLVISGRHIGEEIMKAGYTGVSRDQGSVIVILATDVPLTARQLARVSRRAQNGIARTGNITGSGSGEIVISMSTAHRISHYPDDNCNGLCTYEYLHEDYMDLVFTAICDAVEESVISSLIHAETNEYTADKVSTLRDWL